MGVGDSEGVEAVVETEIERDRKKRDRKVGRKAYSPRLRYAMHLLRLQNLDI